METPHLCPCVRVSVCPRVRVSVCPCVRVCTDLFVPCTRTCKDTQPLRSRAPCTPRAFDVTLYSCIPGFCPNLSHDPRFKTKFRLFKHRHRVYPPDLLFLALRCTGTAIRNCKSFFSSGPQSCVCYPLQPPPGRCSGCAHKCTFSVVQQNKHLGRVEPKPWRNPGDVPVRQEILLLLLLLPETSKLYNPDVLRVSEQLAAAAAVVFMVKSKAIAVVYNLRASSLAKNAGCSLLYTYLTQMLRVSPTVDSRFLQRLVFSDPSIRIKNELSFSCICFGKREII